MPKNTHNKQARSDAGAAEAFRPARYEKPEQSGFLQRVAQAFRIAFGRPTKTSEQGASGSASPTNSKFQLYEERYDRRQKIQDCRLLYEDDHRAKKAVNMYCQESTRDGVSILVNQKALRGLPAQWARLAKECAADVEKIVNSQIDGWARMLFVEGDLFIQAIFDEEERLCDAVRMPAIGMERLTNDADRFVNPDEAFEQIDVQLQTHVAFFSDAIMKHVRWEHISGYRYGNSGLVSVRRARRLLKLMEEAQVLRRILRAPQRIVWNLGTEEDPSPPEVVNKFREDNGFLEGVNNPYDILNTAMDYFGNGRLKAEAIAGDPKVAETDDLEYFQDNFAAGLPTPAPVYNLSSKNVNTDILKDLRAEWLKTTKLMTSSMDEVVRWLMDMALLQRGILPKMLTYETHYSESTVQTTGEIIENIRALRSNTVGAGNTSTPDPLVSQETAIGLLREHVGIKDVQTEIKLLEVEREQRYEQQLQSMQANVTGRVTAVNPEAHPTSASAKPAEKRNLRSSASQNKARKDALLYIRQ